MKRRILLVGSDQPLWREFVAQSADDEGEWLPLVAGTAKEALAAIETESFETIVADAQLTGLHGVELLDELMRIRPDSRRIVLSDLADCGSTLQCIGKAHRHLVKPCNAETLRHALNEVLTNDHWLPGAAVQKLMPAMRWVPSPPEIYFNVLSETQSPDASIEKIGELISRDPAMTAKLLQLANSAVFGLQLQVVQPTEAVAYIGLETTQSLLLLVHTFDSFESLQAEGFSVDALWRHSLLTGQFARIIARAEGVDATLAEQAFTAGLLHDIGKLLFAANLKKEFSEALRISREKAGGVWEAEIQVFGACHGQTGAALLGIWGLPSLVIEAIALHHSPGCRADSPFSPLTAVHAANVIAHEQSGDSDEASLTVDQGYLTALGLDDRMDVWRSLCLQERDAAV